MRVAQHDARAHADQLVHEEQPRLEQLLEHEQQAFALRGDDDRDRHQIRRERGPGPILQFRHVPAQVRADAALLVGVDDEPGAIEARPDAEPLERHQCGAQIIGAHAVDRDGAVRHGREPEERADLDVVGADREGRRTERRAPLDRERIAADPVDPAAQADQIASQILHVRLAGGIAEDRGPRGRHRSHEGVLGRGDARLIQEDVRAAQRLRLELVRRADRDLGAQSFQREEVGVHPPATDHVAPGRRQVHPPEPRQHRPREQNGRADPGGELGVELPRLGRGGVYLDRVRRRPRDRRAQMGQQLEHGLDVADVGNVVDAAGPVGEQGGRQDGQRCVLVPRRADRPLERAAARDAERRRHR